MAMLMVLKLTNEKVHLIIVNSNDFLIEMARYLNIKLSQNKESLVKCIFRQYKEKEALKKMYTQKTVNYPFTKNKNTIPTVS